MLPKYIAGLVYVLSLLSPCSVFALERYTGDGENVDFAIEQRGEVAELFIAQKPSNKPLEGASVRYVPDDETKPPIVFSETDKAGVYKLTYDGGKLPEGQVVVGDEGIDAYIEEAGHGHGHGHDDHSHGRTSGESLPLWLIILFAASGGLVIGAISVRLFSGRRLNLSAPNVAGLLVLVLMSSSSSDIFAGEGHSHGEAKISDAPIGSEVKMTKRSQFMIGLRTEPALTEEHNLALETFGHLIAKPSLNAVVTAPRSGFVKGEFDGLWGKEVKEGTVLAQIESVGAIQVRAPISGTIVEVSAVPGMRVDQGASLFRIVDMRKLWVDAEVFQKYLGEIEKKTGTAQVKIEGVEQQIEARITGAFSGVDENTLTAKVYLEVENKSKNMQLGSSVNIAIPLADKQLKGILLPSKAVLSRGGERLVFIQTAAEFFESRAVAVNRGPTPDTVIVVDGLQDGERVVTSGNYQLLVGAH